MRLELDLVDEAILFLVFIFIVVLVIYIANIPSLFIQVAQLSPYTNQVPYSGTLTLLFDWFVFFLVILSPVIYLVAKGIFNNIRR